LLLVETDLITPLLARLAEALRAEAVRVHGILVTTYGAVNEDLDRDANWTQLQPGGKEEVRALVGLQEPEPVKMTTDEELCNALDRRSLRAMRDEIDAVTQRVHRALLEAAKRTSPEKTTTPVTIRKCTLEDQGAVQDWIKEQEQKLMAAVAKGPVIIN